MQGDIGTSIIYVFAQIFATADLAAKPPERVREDVYGAISLIFWTLTTIALIKYVLIVLRANDTGEGGPRAWKAVGREPSEQLPQRMNRA